MANKANAAKKNLGKWKKERDMHARVMRTEYVVFGIAGMGHGHYNAGNSGPLYVLLSSQLAGIGFISAVLFGNSALADEQFGHALSITAVNSGSRFPVALEWGA